MAMIEDIDVLIFIFRSLSMNFKLFILPLILITFTRFGFCEQKDPVQVGAQCAQNFYTNPLYSQVGNCDDYANFCCNSEFPSRNSRIMETEILKELLKEDPNFGNYQSIKDCVKSTADTCKMLFGY